MKIEITPEEKARWWGEGEWVDEEDTVEFYYKDYKCRVVRCAALEGALLNKVFGGHLCGYVQLHETEETSVEFDYDVHGGITYQQKEDDGLIWVGFDCAHSFDFIPSMEFMYKTDPNFMKIREDSTKLFEKMGLNYFNSPINRKSYKNIAFCIAECKGIVDQIILSLNTA